MGVAAALPELSERTLQLCEDQSIPEKPKKRVVSHVLAILMTYIYIY